MLRARGTVSNSAVFVTAPVNARPIVKVTPNVISQCNASSNGLNPFLDRRLDEMRLPPANDPFYNDDRFAVTVGSGVGSPSMTSSKAQQSQCQSPGRRRVEVCRRGRGRGGNRNGSGHSNGHSNGVHGGKRSFSKMQRDDPVAEKRQLMVQNVPSHLNTMSHLTSHFSRFGDIQHLQVFRDRNRAFVQFSTHSEALEALECPDPVLDEPRIETVWAFYNRRGFDRRDGTSASSRTAAKQSTADPKGSGSGSGSGDGAASGSGSGSGSAARSEKKWISAEYRSKLESASGSPANEWAEPPAKRQRVEAVAVTVPESAVVIPEDVSEKVASLRLKLLDSLRMYEELESGKVGGDSAEKDALKKSVKAAIERFECELQKLIDHQKRRQEAMEKVAAERESASKWRGSKWRGYGRGSGWRGRGRGGWRGRGSGPGSGRGRGRGRGSSWSTWRGRGRGYGLGASWSVKRTVRGRGRGRGRGRARGRGRGQRRGSERGMKADLSGKSVDYRSSVLMVDDVPENADEHELRCHFSKFGDIESTDLVSGGRAKVAFQRRADAQKALSDGTQFHPDPERTDHSVTLKLRFVELHESLPETQRSATITADDVMIGGDGGVGVGIDVIDCANGDDHENGGESIKTVITIADDDDGKATVGSESTNE